jgi:hypothetical protein
LNNLLLPGFTLPSPASDADIEPQRMLLLLRHPKDVAFDLLTLNPNLSPFDLLPFCFEIVHAGVYHSPLPLGQHSETLLRSDIANIYSRNASLTFLRRVSSRDIIGQYIPLMSGRELHPYFRLLEGYRDLLTDLRRKEAQLDTIHLFRELI